MTKPTPHPHAEFIAEAAKDINRKIRSTDCYMARPRDSDLYSVVNDIEGRFKFCFADTEEQQPKIVSSLTDKELLDAYWDMGDYDRYVNLAHELRAVADAAAQRAIEEFLTAFLHRHTKNSIAVNQAYELFSDMKEGKL